MGNVHNHEERRDRLLLLHKKEIRELKNKVNEKGLTLIPLSMYFKNGKIKLKFGLGKGKKLHDKRASAKEKEAKSIIKEYQD
jgi:SsrA-binding protein